MHQRVDNVLQTLVYENSPRNTGNAKDLVDEALSIVQHTICFTVDTTLGSIPGSLAFNRDTFLNILLITNWYLITTCREYLVNEDLRKVNEKHRTFNWVANQKVLKKQLNWTLEQVIYTRNLSLHKDVTKQINIGRVIGFRENI